MRAKKRLAAIVNECGPGEDDRVCVGGPSVQDETQTHPGLHQPNSMMATLDSQSLSLPPTLPFVPVT